MKVSFSSSVDEVQFPVWLTIDVHCVGERSGTPDALRITSHGAPGLQSYRPGLGRRIVSPRPSFNTQLLRASDLPATLERASEHQVCRHWLGTNAE